MRAAALRSPQWTCRLLRLLDGEEIEHLSAGPPWLEGTGRPIRHLAKSSNRLSDEALQHADDAARRAAWTWLASRPAASVERQGLARSPALPHRPPWRAR